MAILNKEQAQAILKKALGFSKADECTVSVNGSDGGNIRYARNSVSTAGDQSVMSLFVNSAFGKRSAAASINEFDDASLEKVVRRSEELAKLAPENPEYMPLLGPQTYLESTGFKGSTAALNPERRADAVAKSLQVSKQAKLQAAGFLENTTSFGATMNSKGLFGYSMGTDVEFSVTLRNDEGTGSGYANRSSYDFDRIDTLALTRIAAMKANSSVGAKAIEPGKYTVILEPMAAADIMGPMFFGFDARNAEEGRSYMSKKGGGTRLGEKLFDERVNIYTDPQDPNLPFSPISGDGRPQKKTVWVENGVVKNLSYSRYWAQKKGVDGPPPARGAVMLGGNASIEDMIKSTERGILVTRFWYIRPVDPQTGLLTGLTRDGTFYIENGKIQFPIKNLRWNESPVIMLNNVEELGKPERTRAEGGDLYLPAMKVRDFTFTSLSDAV